MESALYLQVSRARLLNYSAGSSLLLLEIFYRYRLTFGVRKCLHGHKLFNKAYLSNITVTDFSAFYLQDGGGKSIHAFEFCVENQ